MSGTIGSDAPYSAPPDPGAGQGSGNYGPPGVAASGAAAAGYDGTAFAPHSRGGGGNIGGRGGDRWPGGRGGGGGGGGGGRGGGGGPREGDWVCSSASCGNVNFSRRMECNKCGAARPTGGQPGSYNGERGGAGNYGNQGSGRSGTGYGMQSGRGGGGYNAMNNNGNQSGPATYGPDNNYVKTTPGGGYHAAPGYGGNEDQSVSGGNYGGRPRVAQPGGRGFGERSNSGGPPGNIYNNSSGYPSSGGPRISGSHISQQGIGNMEPRVDYVKENSRPPSGYGVPDAPSVKQCDENCGDSCDNSRIYISELPLDVTSDELRELFGGIGQVARIKQKRGYKDQWPWNIKIYRDEAGKNKGDAVLSYEDPSAAHAAGAFFNDYSMRGHNIKVTMAEKYAPKPTGYGHGSGGGGYGGDRGFSGGGGPDRRAGGGYRSRPY
eukprot:c22070_g1_i1 orf=319-1623(-)